MKKLSFILFSFFSLYARELDTNLLNKLQHEWNLLNEEQKQLAFKIFQRGKEDDIAETATAIAWKETQFNKYNINTQNKNKSWDCGLFNNNSKTVLSRIGLKHSFYNKKMICSKLTRDNEYSYQWMVKEIKHWKENNEWFETWGKYNSGNQKNVGYKYANNILHRIIIIRLNINKVVPISKQKIKEIFEKKINNKIL